jgi:hypothetical protein
VEDEDGPGEAARSPVFNLMYRYNRAHATDPKAKRRTKREAKRSQISLREWDEATWWKPSSLRRLLMFE